MFLRTIPLSKKVEKDLSSRMIFELVLKMLKLIRKKGSKGQKFERKMLLIKSQKEGIV